MLNRDSRSRSAVGRIAGDFGPASVRPRRRPPTTRISAAAAVGAARRRRDPARDGGRCRRALAALLRLLRRPRLAEAFDSDAAALAVAEELRRARLLRRLLARLDVVAARAVEFSLQLFCRTFLFVRAPGM